MGIFSGYRIAVRVRALQYATTSAYYTRKVMSDMADVHKLQQSILKGKSLFLLYTPWEAPIPILWHKMTVSFI